MRADAFPTTARSWTPSARRSRAAAAGFVAATICGLQEPIDRRLLGCDYSDVEFLGKAVTRGRGSRAAGFAVHAVNGAIFGLAFNELRKRVPIAPRRLAIAAAVGEHMALYPLFYFIDRPLLTSPCAFAQQTWRHALFGFVLGRLA
jgi:hypothetical protein